MIGYVFTCLINVEVGTKFWHFPPDLVLYLRCWLKEFIEVHLLLKGKGNFGQKVLALLLRPIGCRILPAVQDTMVV